MHAAAQRKTAVKDSGEETIGDDKKLFIEWCIKSTCDPDYKTCYCCQTLPNQTCYFDQHKCWDIYPAVPLLRLIWRCWRHLRQIGRRLSRFQHPHLTSKINYFDEVKRNGEVFVMSCRLERMRAIRPWTISLLLRI
jgi:hypothetical protein